MIVPTINHAYRGARTTMTMTTAGTTSAVCHRGLARTVVVGLEVPVDVEDATDSPGVLGSPAAGRIYGRARIGNFRPYGAIVNAMVDM